MPECAEILTLHWPGGGVVLRCETVAGHEGAHAGHLTPRGEDFRLKVTWRSVPGR